MILKEQLGSYDNIKWIGSTNPEDSVKICAICRGKVYEESNLIICPFCTSAYHGHHLAEWLSINNHCPMCRRGFKDFILDLEFHASQERSPQISRVSPIRNSHAYRKYNPRSTAVITRGKYNNEFQRINAEDHTPERKLRLISALVVFWIFLVSENTLLALFASIFFVPLIIYVFLECLRQKMYYRS